MRKLFQVGYCMFPPIFSRTMAIRLQMWYTTLVSPWLHILVEVRKIYFLLTKYSIRNYKNSPMKVSFFLKYSGVAMRHTIFSMSL